MFNFLSFLMSSVHSIPFRHAIHFLACITLDLISLSSVSLVSKITPRYLYSWQDSISLSLISNFCAFAQYISILFWERFHKWDKFYSKTYIFSFSFVCLYKAWRWRFWAETCSEPHNKEQFYNKLPHCLRRSFHSIINPTRASTANFSLHNRFRR